MARFLKLPFFRMGLVLSLMSLVHFFLFGVLREGLLLAAVVSYFSAFGFAYSWRWVLPWAAALAAGVFIRGAAAAAFAILVYLALAVATPLLLARGAWGRLKSLFFFTAGLFASGLVLLATSPFWRDFVPHPFGFLSFGEVVPTPVDLPWYFLGYYIWERVHSLYKGLPKSWRAYLTYRA